jgi:transcriptional regulator with XRE-family HTH domain
LSSWSGIVASSVGLGEKIKQARDDAGLTQDDLAYQLRSYPTLDRTSGTQLAKWEKNAVDRLSFYAIEAIALETGKPLEFFSEQRAADAGTISSPAARHELDPDDRAGALAARSVRRAPLPKGRRRRRTSSDPEQG